MKMKAINVDEKKWDTFKKWCVNNDTTIQKQIDKFL